MLMLLANQSNINIIKKI